MKKVLFIVPHLSTGGLPQYTLSLIKKIKDEVDVYCIEYSMIADIFVVQRKQIVNLLGNKFYSLKNEKTELNKIIKEINPDIVHLQEMPEFFMDRFVANKLYSIEREYKIIETSHDSSFDYTKKLYFPDYFALISEYQRQNFSKLNIPITILEADIEYKEKQNREEGLKKLGLDPNLKHVLNVGLFTSRKNQAEIFDYAKKLIDYPIQFHFIGNQADNFRSYWQPLLNDCPPNVKIWGERGDVDNFYSCMDLFLFTSRGTTGDKETSPLVIREAIGYGMPSLIYNLPVYLNMYNKYDNIDYLDFDDLYKNMRSICNKLGIQHSINFDMANAFNLKFIDNENKIEIQYLDSSRLETKISIKDIDSNVPIYWFDAVFENKNSYWTIPTPKRVYDFMKDDTFRGFLFEFYSPDDKLLFSKELVIKNSNGKRNVKLNLSNPFDCIFFNYNEMFVNGQYDCYGIKDIDTVFDIGANNGLFSLYLLNNGCKNVYAFEPNVNAIQNIHSILHKHSDYEIVEKAVYTKDEDLTFYISENNSTIGSISKDHVSSHAIPKEITVPAISLKTFIQNKDIKRIGLIKMDIEGAEYDIIDNLDDWIFDITDSFLIEFHSNINGKTKRMIEKIISHGFVLNQIRNQSTSENIDITQTYESSDVGTIYLVREEKKKFNNIKAVQFLLNDNIDKQNKSINNISPIQSYGIEYVQHYNDRYIDLPPVSKCNRPHDVSKELKQNSLTPGHYGCYESFKNVVLSEFDSNLDALIIFEGDAKISNMDLFIKKLEEVLELCNDELVDLISFGGIYDLESGYLQSNHIKKLSDDFFICDKIIGCQCIIIPKHFRKRIKNALLKEKWDALDCYLSNISQSNNFNLCVSNKTIVTQFEGKSDIDGYDKKFKEFEI